MDQKQFSDFVKSKREQEGLTQFKLAVKLGVSLMTINRWESGASMPRDDAVQHWINKIGKVKA